MRRLNLRVVLPVAFSALAVACSNAQLKELKNDRMIQDNKVEFTGSFCTTSPTELDFPVKILFVVDNSDSLNQTDPDYYSDGVTKKPVDFVCVDCTNQRQRAVRDIWERYQNSENYYLSLIQFPANASTNDPAHPTNGFVQGSGDSYFRLMQNPVGLTPMKNALEEAKRQILQDLLKVEPAKRVRLRYVVILFSDGFPQQRDTNLGIAVDELPGDIKQVARDIKELQRLYHLGDVTVNTSFMTGDPSMTNTRIQDAQQLMLDLAQIGDGVFAQFDGTPGSQVTFRSFDFASFVRSFLLKSLVVRNKNVVAKADGTISLDSDGDGLTDDQEVELGIDPRNPDTDGDLVNDFVELTIGADPLVRGDSVCEVDKQGDADGDGLLDCEEILLGTKEYSFDSDLDGLADGMEFSAGTSPNVDDSLIDTDMDGVNNRDEVIQHTLPMTTDPANRPTTAYEYDIKDAGLTNDHRQCYSFTVSNISLGQTLTGADGRAGVNNVCVDILEASRDATNEDHGILRTGCLEFQYLGSGQIVPPGHTIEVKPDEDTRFKRYE
ncbi:MAG: hypothetical protein V1495_10565 [Pseudomonadota bacterium]